LSSPPAPLAADLCSATEFTVWADQVAQAGAQVTLRVPPMLAPVRVALG
jgi:hypothetical protein